MIVVDTVTGKTLQKPIPKTPYGLLFTPDQQALLVYSAKSSFVGACSVEPWSIEGGSQNARFGPCDGPFQRSQEAVCVVSRRHRVRDAETLKLLGFTAEQKPWWGKVRTCRWFRDLARDAL
ncbi:MAG: hypothetical protein IPK53_11205 [bacterium]|nr:hypothetical protein [bacterium]